MKRLTFTCDLVPLLNVIGFTKCENISAEDYSVFVNGIIEVTIEHDTKKVITELVIGIETQECNIESIGDLKVLCRVVNGLN